MRQSGDFGNPKGPWVGAVATDPSTGFPLEDFSVIALDLTDHTGPQALSETIIITGRAAALPTVGCSACQAKVLNSSYLSATGDFTVYVQLEDSNMYTPTFTGTQGGVTALSILRTGLGCEGAGVGPYRWNQHYVDHISGRCSIVRLMDWGATNGNNISSWADRTPVTWPQWNGAGRAHGGSPWEVAFDLVTRSGAQGVWLNMPFYADDEYITSFAQLAQQLLPASVAIYTEFCNEVWNFAFQQSHWQVDAANASVTQGGDPYRLNYDNSSNAYYWAYRLTAYQAAVRIPALFSAVFGAGAVGRDLRVRPILAGQIGYYLPLQQGVDYLTTVHGPLAGMLHGVAGAPYFGVYKAADTASIDAVLAGVAAEVDTVYCPSCGWGADGQAGDYAIGQLAGLAAYHRVFAHGYEGGPDFSTGGLNYTMTGTAQRDPRFAAVMQRYYQHWAGFGATRELNQFTAGADNWFTQFGCWGLCEDVANCSASPKLVGFDAARTSPMPATAFGIVPPTAGFPGGYFVTAPCANATNCGPFSFNAWSTHSPIYPVNLAAAAASAGQVLTVTVHGSTEGGASGPQAFDVTLNADAGRVQHCAFSPSAGAQQSCSASFTLTPDDVGLMRGAAGVMISCMGPACALTISTLDFAL